MVVSTQNPWLQSPCRGTVPLQRCSPDDLEMRFPFNQLVNYLDGPHPLTISSGSTPLRHGNLGATALLYALVSHSGFPLPRCKSRPALWLKRGAVLG